MYTNHCKKDSILVKIVFILVSDVHYRNHLVKDSELVGTILSFY